LFDNPMSTGFIDRSTGALFAFGALLPEATQSANDVAPEALAGGIGRLGYQRLALGRTRSSSA